MRGEKVLFCLHEAFLPVQSAKIICFSVWLITKKGCMHFTLWYCINLKMTWVREVRKRSSGKIVKMCQVWKANLANLSSCTRNPRFIMHSAEMSNPVNDFTNMQANLTLMMDCDKADVVVRRLTARKPLRRWQSSVPTMCKHSNVQSTQLWNNG
jgi:hypothetical protein